MPTKYESKLYITPGLVKELVVLFFCQLWIYNKDENVYRYEVRGEKLKLLVKKISNFCLVQRRHLFIKYEDDERYGVSESPKSLGIETLYLKIIFLLISLDMIGGNSAMNQILMTEAWRITDTRASCRRKYAVQR